MKKLKLAFAMCGSFCSIKKSIDIANELSEIYELIPIISFNLATIDTRFGKAKEIREKIESICNRKVIDSIKDAEPIGPKNIADAILVCPCTGNTLGKICNAITDTPVTMAVKSQLRVQKPVIIAFASNDALGFSAQNISKALNTKNIYLTPMSQDDYKNKPNSLVFIPKMVGKTVKNAFKSIQIQPIIM